MYTAFYGLREKPFSLSPDPRFLYLADSHREALAHLLYGIDQEEGFMAITGEVGTGKTTICRTLLERLGPGTEVAFLFNPSRSAAELLQSIALEFGLSGDGQSRHELNDQLNRFLLSKRSEGCKVLLIVDEAQNLGADTLEEIRLLSNLETSTSKLIQILLLGQPELDRKLDSEELRQLRQRISVRWSLAPLTRRETADYVRHRLNVAAGAEREIFSGSALDEIHQRSRGIPRLVNILCDRSLLAGYAEREHRIGAKLVKQAAREIPDTRLRRGQRSPGAASRRRTGLAAAAAAAALLVALIAGERNGLWSEAAVWSHEVVGESRFMGMLTGSGLASEARVSRGVPRELDSMDGPGAALPDVDASAQVRAPVSSPPPWNGATGVSSPPPWNGAMSVSSPAPFQAAVVRDSAPASAEPARGRDERLLNTLPGSFLGRLLDSQGPGSARLDALNAILDSYGLDLVAAAPASDEEALAILYARGLALLPLSGADLSALRSLDHPALLMLRTELDDWRLVALRGLDENLGLLDGAVAAEELQVPVGELELQWEGEAWVVWAPEAGVPEMLTLGDEGAGVVWLQSALADLGYYQGGASGIFDGSTRAGVMALQLDQSLVPDGVAGPRTQMVLYSLLERYEVPRLTGAGEDTHGSLAGAGEEGLRVLSGSMEDLPAASERPEVGVRLSAEDGPG